LFNPQLHEAAIWTVMAEGVLTQVNGISNFAPVAGAIA